MCCFPGANFRNLRQVFDQIPDALILGRTLDIIVHVGINHREDREDLTHTQLDIYRILQSKKHLFHFMEIAVLYNETNDNTIRLNAINGLWKMLMDGYFITAPNRYDTHVAPNDKYSIHYTQKTVDDIQDRMVNHLKSMELNRSTASQQNLQDKVIIWKKRTIHHSQ